MQNPIPDPAGAVVPGGQPVAHSVDVGEVRPAVTSHMMVHRQRSLLLQ